MKKGFTLIELMIVIVILGILAALISGNLIASMMRGRDAKRKEDLSNVQRALEMYYEDVKEYPTSIPFGTDDPLVNPTETTKKYLLKTPRDTMPAFKYDYVPEVDPATGKNIGYRIYSYFENNSDIASGIKLSGYDGTNCCTGTTCKCKYGVASYNAEL